MDIKGPSSVDTPEPATAVAPLRTARSASATSAQADSISNVVAETQQVAASTRSARLEQLAAQVANGGYMPDPGAIADQIFDEAQLDAQVSAALASA